MTPLEGPLDVSTLIELRVGLENTTHSCHYGPKLWLDTVFNMIGGTYMTILWARKSSLFLMKKIIIWAPKIMRKMATTFFVGFASHLELIIYFTS